MNGHRSGRLSVAARKSSHLRMTDLREVRNSAPCGIVQRRQSAVLENAQNRRTPGKEPSLHYLRSVLFIAAVVILTIVVSLSVPFMWLFNAGSPTVRAVSQVWARGIMWLFR